jgi:hypothetical protein
MALKGPRHEIECDIRFTCPTAIERGVMLTYGTTSASGIALGDSAGTVDVPLSPSGKVPAGLLMCDVISIDETVTQRNRHKDVQKTGENVRFMKKGYATTNMIAGTPAVGGTGYVSTSGTITATVSATGGTAATPKCCQFESIKDADNYVTVAVNLPLI